MTQILFEASSPEAIQAVKGFKEEREICRAFSYSGRLYVPNAKDSSIDSSADIMVNGVEGEPKWLNQWIYSPKVASGGATLNVIWSAERVTGNGHKQCIQTIPVDWEGWKLVSLPLDGFVRRADEEKRLSEDKASIKSLSMLRYNVNGYRNEGGCAIWQEESNLYIDSVWLSGSRANLVYPPQGETCSFTASAPEGNTLLGAVYGADGKMLQAARSISGSLMMEVEKGEKIKFFLWDAALSPLSGAKELRIRGQKE